MIQRYMMNTLPAVIRITATLVCSVLVGCEDLGSTAPQQHSWQEANNLPGVYFRWSVDYDSSYEIANKTGSWITAVNYETAYPHGSISLTDVLANGIHPSVSAVSPFGKGLLYAYPGYYSSIYFFAGRWKIENQMLVPQD